MGASALLDSGAFRALFPSLRRGDVHLASCSWGARAEAVEAELKRMHEVGSAPTPPWGMFEQEVKTLRSRVARFFGGTEDRWALLPNVSTAAFQVASTIALTENRRRIVVVGSEFPSLSQVWLMQRRRGAEVVHVASRDGRVDLEASLRAVDEHTALLSVPWVAYGNGAVSPLAPLIDRAHAAGARVFVDAYQAAGVLPVNVDAVRCDYLALGTYKYLLGLPGTAFLFATPSRTGDLEPELTGWFGRPDPFAFDPMDTRFPEETRRFETGTLSIPSVYAANAALSLLERTDRARVQRHVAGLTALATERLLARGEKLQSPLLPEERGPQVAVVDRNPIGLQNWLGARRMAVSARGDCVRLAFHFYNDEGDVHSICDALAEYRDRH